MTPRQLKHFSTREAVQARIVSDGCRDYIVEVATNAGVGPLRHPRGDLLRFRSLAEVNQVLRRCGIARAVLRQRIAHDEALACSEAVGFTEIPMIVHH